MSSRLIKEFSVKYHNTGGGLIHSQSFLERATRNKCLIVDFCKRNNFKPTKILEIGFGKHPKCLELLNEHFKPNQIYGVDKLDYKNNSNIKTFQSFDQLPENLKFDLIYSIDVMEHVREPSLINNSIVEKAEDHSLIIHSIDLTSHYHNSKSFNAFKHYSYNQKLWDLMTSNRSSYTNRKRSSEWYSLFEKNFSNIFFEEIDHPFKKEIINKFQFLNKDDIVSRINVSMRLK